MADFPIAPTYADVILVNPINGQAAFNPIWLKWFLDLANFVTLSGGASGAPSHEVLTNLLGGAANDHYHLTGAQRASLLAGFTGTGNLVRDNTPTLINPVLGTAVGTSLGLSGDITTGTTTLHRTSVSLGNGAGVGAGTVLNAPAAGNPTKWIPINDNGTVRYVPAW